MNLDKPFQEWGPEELALVERTKLQIRANCMPQVDALIDAGWRFELPNSPDSEPWQWYWRRPPRRAGSKGMFFWSTQQAYNALQREPKLPKD